MPASRSRERIGDSRCHQYRSPAAAKRQVLEHVDGGVLERRVVQRGDVPEPHRADVGDRRRTPGGRTGPAARSIRCTWRVTGRRIHLVSASVNAIGTRSAISRCWIMCAVANCSPRRSSGETSATNRPEDRRPTTGRAARVGAPRAAVALGADPPPAQRVDGRVADQREQDDRRERPAGVDRDAAAVTAPATRDSARSRHRIVTVGC